MKNPKTKRIIICIIVFVIGFVLSHIIYKRGGIAFPLDAKRKRRAFMRNSVNTDNALGQITVDKDVIAKYAGSVAVECFGIVGMASVNARDGFVSLLRRENLTHGINVSITDNQLSLEFKIIVAYGVSIRTVVDNLIDNVKYKVERFTGHEINKIDVYVEDVRVID